MHGLKQIEKSFYGLILHTYVYNRFVKKNHIKFGKIRAFCALFNRIILRAVKLRGILPWISQFSERYTRMKFGACQIGGSVFITRVCSYFTNYVICKTTGKYAALLQIKLRKKCYSNHICTGNTFLPCAYYFTPVLRPLWRESQSPILIYPCAFAQPGDPDRT